MFKTVASRPISTGFVDASLTRAFSLARPSLASPPPTPIIAPVTPPCIASSANSFGSISPFSNCCWAAFKDAL
jgi:hypothetical protein